MELPEIDITKSELVTKFKSSKALERVIAARLSKNYGDTFINELRASLSDNFYEVRSNAAISLGILEDGVSVSKLIKLLEDEVEEVRYSAAEALGNFQDPSIILPLLQALGDHSKETRRQVILSLQKYETEQVGIRAIEWLENIEKQVYEQDTEDSIKKLEVARGIIEATTDLEGQWIDRALNLALESEDDELKRFAAITIGRKQKQQFVNSMLELRNVDTLDLRLGIVYALTELNFENKYNILTEYIVDDYEFIRLTIARYLGQLDPDSSVHSNLTELSKDESLVVRIEVAKSLANFPMSKYLQILKEMSQDDKSYVRQQVVKSLAKISTEQAKEIIKNMKKTEYDDLVKIDIENALH